MGSELHATGASASAAPVALPRLPAPTGRASAAHSRFVQRVRRRYASELGLLPPGLPGAHTLSALLQRLLADGRPLACALRVAR